MTFTRIPGTKIYDHKRYERYESFVSKAEAARIVARKREEGYYVRVYTNGGTMHFSKPYHIYIRRK